MQERIEACKQSGAPQSGALDDNNHCGCEGTVCNPDSACFHGECCNPLEHTADPLSCGCAAACPEGHVCAESLCCDPATADSPVNCGCKGPCGDGERCALHDGEFVCECDPVLHMTDDTRCGCQDGCDITEACQPLQEPDPGDPTRVAECRCNPSDPDSQTSRTDCGCRGTGPLPDDAVCTGGVPQCVDADEVWCDKQCVPKNECLCVPEEHVTDNDSCACEHPCAPGDRCVPCTEEEGCVAKCECDPEQNFANNASCGCVETCDVGAGLTCQNKHCQCDPSNFDNPNNCNCSDVCDAAHNEACINKICQCAEPNNPYDCGCSGVACNVAAGWACIDQVCQCTNMNNPKNCGCTGVVCGPDEKCQSNVCVCADPNNADNCGCSGGPCPGDFTCQNGGACECPVNTYHCETVPDLAPGVETSDTACQPVGNGNPQTVPFVYCGDCVTKCGQGKVCKPVMEDDLITGYQCVTELVIQGGGG